MTLGHIHRRMAGGSTPSYTEAIAALGGTIRFYYPITESSQTMSTSYPPGTPWNMTAGTITNNSYGGGIIANGGLTKVWNGGHTAPEGVAGLRHQSGEGGATVIVTRDISGVWNVTQAYCSIWLSMDSNQITKNGHTLIQATGLEGGNAFNFIANPVSNNFTIWGLTPSLTGSDWLNPVYIVLQETFSTNTTCEVFINGVSKGTATPYGAGTKGCILRPSTLQTAGVVTATPARYYYSATAWLGVTGAAPTAGQHLSIYNSYKDA